MEKESRLDDIDLYIDRLAQKTKSVKLMGTFLVLLTASNLVSLVVLYISNIHATAYFFSSLGSFAGTVFLLSFAAAYRFEVLRREGEILFEVISDELHGMSRHVSAPDERQDGANASMRAKYVLREFSRSSDLPLIPGRHGPAFLCLLNFVLVFVYRFFMGLPASPFV